MGGGLSRREPAGAVSAAGGLGTIGFLAPADLRREIEAARALTDRPLSVNLLLPFARTAHFPVRDGPHRALRLRLRLAATQRPAGELVRELSAS